MEIRHLRCFVTVAEELHFGRAAARLHVAQPAVSQTIRQLEAELGVILFDRANRKVALTDAGRALADEARAVLGRFDDLVATMGRLRTGVAGNVSIGAVAALPPELIPGLLSRLAAAGLGPSPVVRAVPSGRDPASLLEGGAFDVVLVRGVVEAPGIGTKVVVREPVGVALPVTHALANQTSVTPAELNGVPLISFGRSTDPAEFDRVYTTLASAGLTDLRLGHESHAGAVDASLRMVASGAGASLKLLSEVTAFGSPTVVWRPLDGVDVDVVVSAAWRHDRTTPSLRRLLDLFE